jgi:YgiT-type zinc finger domain-containing protein
LSLAAVISLSVTVIETIRKKVRAQQYEFAIPHFFEEMANDGLIFADIEMAVANGRIRRRFTRDPRGARYEVVGTATDGRQVAVKCMSNHVTKYDYGECHICGERMEEKIIKQDFWIRGKLIVIEGVPTGVCPQCGEKVVKADVGQRIAALIGNVKQWRKARTISVPVIHFAKEVA